MAKKYFVVWRFSQYGGENSDSVDYATVKVFEDKKSADAFRDEKERGAQKTHECTERYYVEAPEE